MNDIQMQSTTKHNLQLLMQDPSLVALLVRLLKDVARDGVSEIKSVQIWKRL